MARPLFTKAAMKSFFYWVNERHAIYTRRHILKQPWPWTKDPILRDNKFCEVFRELDRTTIWIRKNWREPYAEHKNLWFAMAMARQINLPATLAEIGFPKRFSAQRTADIIAARMARGERGYSGAYIITGGPGGSKSRHTAFGILAKLYRKPPAFARVSSDWRLETAFNQLLEYPGFGRFMAYEVVTDLRHTRYLRDAPDIMTWANAGPGAHRGLRRMKGFSVRGDGAVTRYPEEEALDLMCYLLQESPKWLGDHVPRLELRDIEHSLCEADKYWRVKSGEGILKRYRPPHSRLL